MGVGWVFYSIGKGDLSWGNSWRRYGREMGDGFVVAA